MNDAEQHTPKFRFVTRLYGHRSLSNVARVGTGRGGATVNDDMMDVTGPPFGFIKITYSTMSLLRDTDSFEKFTEFKASVASYNRKQSTDFHVFKLTPHVDDISRAEWVKLPFERSTEARRDAQSRRQFDQAFGWLRAVGLANPYSNSTDGARMPRLPKGALRLGTLLRVNGKSYVTRRTEAASMFTVESSDYGKGQLGQVHVASDTIATLTEAFDTQDFNRWWVDSSEFSAVEAGTARSFRVLIRGKSIQYMLANFVPIADVWDEKVLL